MKLFALRLSLLLCFSLGVAGASGEPLDLNAGYRQMYNLNFAGAHQTFARWQQQHPQDPLGPVSDAAAYLFAEFDRLKILEFDLFTDDSAYDSRPKLVPDPSVKAAFDQDLSKADALVSQVLARSPQDTNAMFAQILANGLRGDYSALVEKKNFAGFRYMKNSRVMAEKLLNLDPSRYDAYLAVGVENYLLSLNPAPVRWILRMAGAETEKARGIQELRLTAEKGHLLAPYARLLLAVAALRDKDHTTARSLLSGLAQEFPQNNLYKKELERIQP